MAWKPSDKAGEGKHTPMKEQGFAAIFAACISISKGGEAIRWPYWHIDLNAGPGWNIKAKCPGSPLVFLQQAIRNYKARRPFNALFCDNNPDFIESLRLHLQDIFIPDDCSVVTRCQDNTAFLQDVTSNILKLENPRYAVGSLLCDPNGYPHGFPLKEIRAFAHQFPRIDIILNLNVSLFARVFFSDGEPREQPLRHFEHFVRPEDMLRSIPRRYWMVSSPPIGGDGERFVVALGRNFDSGQRQFMHFYSLDSQQGLEIIRYFRHQPPDQPLLPGIED